MHLSPQEKDKLLVVTAALLAERRLKRGLKLNHPEAIALLSFQILEGARDGKSVSELFHYISETQRQCALREELHNGLLELEAVAPGSEYLVCFAMPSHGGDS